MRGEMGGNTQSYGSNVIVNTCPCSRYFESAACASPRESYLAIRTR